LSHTHAENTSHNVLMETPAAEIPKGNAWRGWLWAVLILAFLAIAVRFALRYQLEGS
jgi:hypothetical protein